MRKRHITYLVLLLLAALSSCGLQDDALKWQVTLNREDKKPYGTYLAYESLRYYFPGAKAEALPDRFRYNNIDTGMMSRGGSSLLVLEGLDFYLSEDEWAALKQYASRGNEVMIFCNSLDGRIEQELGCDIQVSGDPEYPAISQPAAANKDVLHLVMTADKKYGYEGRTIQGYFSGRETAAYDTVADSTGTPVQADTLGYAGGKVNFMRYSIGTGHIALHAAPLALSNYFLLQGDNYEYLTGIWRTLPPGIDKIYWNGYFKRTGETEGAGMLWRHPATRLALLLALLVVATYVLFEGKRRQRIIPVIPLLRNDSVSFVETVGRLYYNKGDNANLAGKMVQQYLEWVRRQYGLGTNVLDEQFTQQLAARSGQPLAKARGLVAMIHEVRIGDIKTDDAYLYELYNTIQQFYKNDRR